MTIISSKDFVNTNYSKYDCETRIGTFNGITGVSKDLKNYLPMVLSLRIKNAPSDLVLLMNPNTLTHSLTKKITPAKTRADSFSSGYVVQFARDELDTLQASGVIAMMYDFNYGLCSTDILSESYDHFQKILAFYDNNGVNFNSKFFPIVDSVGRVVITYDGYEYSGCFDNFSYKQVANDPFNFTFSWDFTISSFDKEKLTTFPSTSLPNIPEKTQEPARSVESKKLTEQERKKIDTEWGSPTPVEEIPVKNIVIEVSQQTFTESIVRVQPRPSIVRVPVKVPDSDMPEQSDWMLQQQPREIVQLARLQNYQTIGSNLFKELNAMDSTAFIRDANIFELPATNTGPKKIPTTTEKKTGVKK